MAISLKHLFQSAKSDGADTTLVQPSNWNAEHTLSMGTGKLVGRTTASDGAAEEIAAGTGLTLSSGTLSVTANTYAAQGANTDITSVYLSNTGLKLKDTNASHGLIVSPGSDLTADRTLTVTTGDAARTLTISGNATVSQDYSTSGNPQFATIELGAASDTTVSRSSAGVIAVEGVTVPLNSITNTHTAQQIELGHASDTTITRVSAGVVAVEGVNLVKAGAVTSSGLTQATSTLLGRTTAGTGAVEEITVGSGLTFSAGTLAASASGGVTVTTYTSGSGNWTVPSSGTYALVRAWGGGGSGGRGGATSARAGGGGGGAYSERYYKLSDLGAAGASIAYAVGAGGTAVSAAGIGNPGGNSTFSSGATLLTAYAGGAGFGNVSSPGGGGGGGILGAGGSGGSSVLGAAGTLGGGVGSGGAATLPWGGGGGGDQGTAGGNTFIGGGGGGGASGSAVAGGTSAVGGAGGASSAASGTPGTSGSAPGGGGGGQGANGGTSGAGGNGRIEIWVW